VNISVIIPLFNEETTVVPVCGAVVDSLKTVNASYEIILVDDGSTDATAQRMAEAAGSDGRIKPVFLKRNFGQTPAIMAGIHFSSGDIIVTIDGDLQNDPKDIPRLVAKLDEGYDVVSGWRNRRRDAWLTRVIPSRIANALISRISGVRLRDYGCTLKAYRRSVIKDVHLYGEMHRFIPIYATWQGAKVTELPVTHHPRTHGRSKYGLSRTFKVILDLLVVKFLASYSQKPIYVFGGFGLLSFLFSFICAGFMVYFKYWGGKTFIQTPLPQLVVLFFLIGFMSILMGFLAEIQMRTYYESQNKPIYLVKETPPVDKK
jgi:glycosyltransferase involved in cell wall biosynthesis